MDKTELVEGSDGMALIEISADALASAVAAQRGGAQRVELCTALREGGLTPSLGLLRAVRAALSIEVHVLLRPRAGDFLYSEGEFAILLEDLRVAVAEGADGVVLGLLTPEGDVDEERTKALVAAAGPLPVTFHRAFDMTRDPAEALRAVLRCGAQRILTSGGAPTAIEGTARLRELVQLAGTQMEIAVGGGVRPHNIAELAARTGATAFHSSMAHAEPSPMRFRRPELRLGAQDVEEYSRIVVREADVRALVTAASMTLQR